MGVTMLGEVVSLIFLSLLLGSLYGMMALGITMTYKIARFANFAHAEFVTVGAYLTVILINFFEAGLISSAFCAFLISAILALISDELVFKPLFNRGGTPLHLLVASIGVGLVIRYVLSILADLKGILCIQSHRMPKNIAFIMGATITDLHIWVLATLLMLVTFLHCTLTYTKFGKAMRAVACNFDLAQTSGIDTDLVRRVTWVLAGGLAGLAGMFWSIYAPINPETGWRFLLYAFAASIMGGMISFYGTIAAGLIVGFTEVFGIYTLNKWFGVNLAYRLIIPFSMIIAILLFRPSGLVGIKLEKLKKLAYRILKIRLKESTKLRREKE